MSWLGELLEQNSSDPRERLELGQQLLSQLQISRLSSDSTLLNDFCDLVVQWLSGSNYKVALLAVEIIDVAIEVSADVISPYLLDRVRALVERLGDSKQSVREAMVQLLAALANTPHCSPQTVLEKISFGLNHRQWLVRIGTMNVIKVVLEHQRRFVEPQIHRMIPSLCHLMVDPNIDVREIAASTLIVIFWHLGENVLSSIRKRQLIPEPKFQMLMTRFNEAQMNGNHVSSNTPTTSQRTGRSSRRSHLPQKPLLTPRSNRGMVGSRKGQLLEEQENSTSVPSWQRASSVPAHKRPLIVSAKGSSSAGSVSDEAFQRAFTEVPKCNVFSSKQLKDQISEACAVLENTDLDWSRRMIALKTLRSVIIGGGLDYSDFSEEVREMQAALLTSVKDLRSQLCREACVTIAFFCERLGLVMVHVIDALMPTLISLMQNSAKVMATSAQLALQYVVKYVCSARLLPHLQTAMSSKSKEIRRNTASLFLMALTLWESRTVEKNMNIFLECIKASINDADPETRRTGRELFMQLDQEYKKQADMLYKALDPSKQRTLPGFVSQSSSSQSIISERDALPISQRNAAYVLHKASPSYYSGRSTSDIDPGAVRRVTNRTVRTASKWGGPLQQVNGTPSTTQMRTSAAQRLSSASQKFVSSLRRVPPTPTNYVRSQPGSRSSSPASRFPARIPPRSQMSSRTKIQIDEPEDHASVSSDSFRFETMELATALSCCASSSTTEKKEGLKALFTIISSDKQVNEMDLKKIVERLTPLIVEAAHKLLQPLTDTLIALVRRYHEELNDWLNLLIPKLVNKCSTEVLPSNLEKYRILMEAVRTSFDPEKQLYAICKFIRDPVRNNVSVKTKHGLLMYLHDLMRGMDSAPSMNQSEVRQAVSKIFQWVDDPKNICLMAISEKVVCDMFHLNASDFTSMLATFPNDLKDRLQTIVRKNSFCLSTGNGINTNEARVGILETTAQINDFVDRRTGLPISSPRVSPQLINGLARSPYDSIPLRRASREDQSGSLSGYILDPQGFADDPEQQEELITKIGEELSLHNQRSEERQRAMSVLSQITRDNLFSLWDKHFKMIFLLLIETLKDSDENIRRMALKLLKEICYAQASRFNEFAEMALMRVLDACTDESKLVVTAAEECGGVLATHVSSATCRRVLLAIIKSDVGEPKIHIAIKLLTKVIESLSATELELILDEVAPPIVDTYNYVSSSIRKESVVCLVAMIMLVGEEHMAPYLSELNKGKQKLIDVYVKRMKGIFE
ncbi:Uncharacterized protein BM_BM2056 [Brugia malayi]|uniref:TOG domain-containing protein n=6 Tax=Brugia TaxID=6278 RepID=A0A4E9F459_BRUMA|nr:Uncharacterized protein BM_BM2056 [Brugia malayi]VIO91504.1 Uncharacterized protein BM_BM2056 [Brugia malayi]